MALFLVPIIGSIYDYRLTLTLQMYHHKQFSMYFRLASILFISFFFSIQSNYAQLSKVCGTSASEFEIVRNRLIQNKAYLKENKGIASSRNAVTYVPIKFHLVGEDNGTGRIGINRVLDQLCVLNETFEEFELQFYLSNGINEVNNSGIFGTVSTGRESLDMQFERDRQAINIWILDDATPTNTTLEGRVLGYYEPTLDWVVVDKDFVNGDGFTLIHELGHYFSLLHPFHGWGDEGAPPYDETYEGKPAPIYAPDPNFTRARILTENADGSNCEVAGDMICDTPAEYLYFTALDNSRCRYSKPMLDPKGDLINPDASLIMGYFLEGCVNRFTAEQVALMKADLQTNARRELRANTPPTINPITAQPTLTDPIDRKVTANYNKVQLKWAATPNATSYIVEVDRVPSFNDGSIRLSTNSTSIVIEDLLEPGRNYFWRVKPYNAGHTCAAASSTERFETGLSTAISAISNINNWELNPNPVQRSGNLYTTIEASSPFDAELNIYNLTGQVVYQRARHFTAGKTAINIPTEALSTGIYIVQLMNENVINNKILIVQ